MMSDVKVLYRYEARDNTRSVVLVLKKFNVVRETECGYWYVPWSIRNHESPMGVKWFKDQQRWVSKNSRKRRCYPTTEEAMESFRIRSQWRLKHLKRQMVVAEAAMLLGSEVGSVAKPEEFCWIEY